MSEYDNYLYRQLTDHVDADANEDQEFMVHYPLNEITRLAITIRIECEVVEENDREYGVMPSENLSWEIIADPDFDIKIGEEWESVAEIGFDDITVDKRATKSNNFLAVAIEKFLNDNKSEIWNGKLGEAV